MANTAGAVQVTPQQLKDKLAEINTIDEWIEAASGGSSGGRITIRNEWVNNAEELVNSVVDQIKAALNKQNATDEFKAGVYYGLNKALKSNFDEDAEKLLNAAAEARKAESGEEAVQASVDEISAKREQRKNLVTQFNALKGILEMFGTDVSDVPNPKVLRGAVKGAKRGPRKINLMKFSVDGVEVPEDKNSLSGIAELVGAAKAKEVRDALKAAGVNTADPDNFEVEVNGHKVSGVKTEVADTATEAETSPESVAV